MEELRATEEERAAGPVWLEDWRGLSRRRAACLLALAAEAGVVLILFQLRRGPTGAAGWVVAGTALVLVAWVLQLTKRMHAHVPTSAAAWWPRWRADRRCADAWFVAALIALTGLALLLRQMRPPDSGLRIAGLAGVTVLGGFAVLVLLGAGAQALERAAGRVPQATDADVLERWRREEVAEQAQAERDERQRVLEEQERQARAEREERQRRREQERLCREVQQLGWWQRDGFQRTLMVSVNNRVMPFAELAAGINEHGWHIREVRWSYRVVHHPSKRVPDSNALLAAAGHYHTKPAWDERVPDTWTAIVDG